MSKKDKSINKNIVYMKLPKYSGSTYCLAIVLALILPVLIFAFVFVFSYAKGIRVEDTNASAVYVSSGDDLVKGLKANSLLGKEFGANKTYVLSEDIELSENNLKALQDISFFGRLDGNGHVITTQLNIARPLIKTLADGATIERVEFENLTITPAESDAAIVGNNYGTLSDIRVKNASIEIDGVTATKTCAVATLAAYNLGKIERCVVDVTVSVNENFTNEQHANQRVRDWKCIVAAAVAVNGDCGEMSNVIAHASYPSDFVVLSKKNAAINNTVGLVVGQWIDLEVPAFKNVWVIAAQNELSWDGYTTATDVKLATENAAWSLKTPQDISYNGLKTEWEDKVENSVWDIGHDGALPEFVEEEESL